MTEPIQTSDQLPVQDDIQAPMQTTEVQPAEPTGLERAKLEGKTRADRIQSILRDAFVQTMAEVKAGSREFRSIAKESLTTDSRSDAGAITLDATQATTNDRAQSPTFTLKALFLAVLKAIQRRLAPHLESEEMRAKYADLKRRAVDLDAKLMARYGDRYWSVKRRLQDTKAWYDMTLAEVEATGTIPLERKQSDLETRVGNMGATVARKEQQLKRQLKTFLHTTAEKL